MQRLSYRGEGLTDSASGKSRGHDGKNITKAQIFRRKRKRVDHRRPQRAPGGIYFRGRITRGAESCRPGQMTLTR